LCLTERFGHGQLLFPEIAIEIGNQQPRRFVIYRPQRSNHRLGASHLKGTLQTEQPLATCYFAQTGFAGRLHRKLNAREIEFGDLKRRENSVVRADRRRP
jgi:hypothetical protein